MSMRSEGLGTPLKGIAAAAFVASVAALSVGGSLAFACAAPLAAIAALAATALERKAGLALVSAAWMSNQIVGYGLLGYPQSLNSFTWGAAIGLAAFVAFGASRVAAQHVRSPAALLTISFIVSFAAYELTLSGAGIPLGASQNAFSASVIAHIFKINAISFAGLLAFTWLASHVARFLMHPKQPARLA
jgi:hypothetical protein